MKRKWMLLALLWSVPWVISVQAQAETELVLRLTRNFGTALGTLIQGTFTMQVSGPEDLTRVVFLLDDQKVGEDDAAPFRWQFRTGSYQPGAHRLSAIGYTVSGHELAANEFSRQFLGQGESSRITIVLVVALIALVIGRRILTTWVAKRGHNQRDRPVISGLLGGTICPNCDRPYALPFWAINLMAGRLARCPHCGKWRLVRRVSPEALQAAADQSEEDKNARTQSTGRPGQDAEWEQRLDDSRFDDFP